MSVSPPPRRAAPLWLRIAGASLCAFLAATAVAGVYLGAKLHRVADETVEQRIDGDLGILAPAALGALVRGDRADLAAIAAAAHVNGVRVTVILPDGEVVAESDHP